MKERYEDKIYGYLIGIGSSCAYLRKPIELLSIEAAENISPIGTDGLHIYFDPDAGPEKEDVEHLIIHCLFRHLLKPEKAVRIYWDLACDVSAEYIRTVLFPGEDAKSTGLRIKDALPPSVDPGNAKEVYAAVMELFDDELDVLRSFIRRDDHRFWYEAKEGSFSDWKDALYTSAFSEEEKKKSDQYIGGKAAEEGGRSEEEEYDEWLEYVMKAVWPNEDELPGDSSLTGEYGLSPGCREEKMLLRAEAKYDFSRYLKRFASTKEELRLDLSDFDYIPYYYGIRRYGNMPLIEPLEYAESHKVEDLVIAIDTSGSCSIDIVERFLAEIERILLQKENFFRRMNVHIVQCDAKIRDHRVIHSQEEWKQYVDDLFIKGRGGTDFTPVFSLIDDLRKKGTLKNLKGLLYFTDGNGVYPQEKTPYETAFVFTTRAALEINFPDWIIPLCLDMELPGRADKKDEADIFKLIFT